MSIFEKNSLFLPKELLERLPGLSSSPFQTLKAKSGHFTLQYRNFYLHSRQDPLREAERFASELPYNEAERVYLYIGAGLGYIILASLRGRKMASGVWLEQNPYILRHALETLDFTEFLKEKRLQILLEPIREEDLYESFRGKSTTPVTFVPHRGSFQIFEKDYIRIRNLCESFFRKKDINLATLLRFEKIWTRNILRNLLVCLGFLPISRIFGKGKCPVVIAGAGPSLTRSIEDIRKYRHRFLLVAVDTAVPVLGYFGIDPDLIYTVDPQALNRVYLESYKGNAYLVLDPTTTYLTPRIYKKNWKGFFSLSPFPLTRILESISSEELGMIPFGGSVSTNAYSLAEKMEATRIYLVGQDLGFSFGLAHAKGAVMEENLNFMENRRFRRELHNYRQIFYLPRYREKARSFSGACSGQLVTNEKMILFRNWFSENAHRAVNLTDTGLEIPGLRNSMFAEEFPEEKEEEDILHTRLAREHIQVLFYSGHFRPWAEKDRLHSVLEQLTKELESYEQIVQEGLATSEAIYSDILKKQDDPKTMNWKLRRMQEIDEIVSTHRNLGDILSTSMQRVIYSVTEGFESSLLPMEKENPNLSVAKKSLLLYEGLYNQTKDILWQIRRILLMGLVCVAFSFCSSVPPRPPESGAGISSNSSESTGTLSTRVRQIFLESDQVEYYEIPGFSEATAPEDLGTFSIPVRNEEAIRKFRRILAQETREYSSRPFGDCKPTYNSALVFHKGKSKETVLFSLDCGVVYLYQERLFLDVGRDRMELEKVFRAIRSGK